jgi:hypothetical protein
LWTKHEETRLNLKSKSKCTTRVFIYLAYFDIFRYYAFIVTTLALGSRPKQGLAKVWAKNEA